MHSLWTAQAERMVLNLDGFIGTASSRWKRIKIVIYI